MFAHFTFILGGYLSEFTTPKIYFFLYIFKRRSRICFCKLLGRAKCSKGALFDFFLFFNGTKADYQRLLCLSTKCRTNLYEHQFSEHCFILKVSHLRNCFHFQKEPRSSFSLLCISSEYSTSTFLH